MTCSSTYCAVEPAVDGAVLIAHAMCTNPNQTTAKCDNAGNHQSIFITISELVALITTKQMKLKKIVMKLVSSTEQLSNSGHMTNDHWDGVFLEIHL